MYQLSCLLTTYESYSGSISDLSLNLTRCHRVLGSYMQGRRLAGEIPRSSNTPGTPALTSARCVHNRGFQRFEASIWYSSCVLLPAFLDASLPRVNDVQHAVLMPFLQVHMQVQPEQLHCSVSPCSQLLYRRTGWLAGVREGVTGKVGRCAH